ncbi:MmcQ/YjbR family DNA-binding protein [Arcanobacterium haemolyticum]|nr:MmcQ/YjbR family DNA-binding protein [Arcanobacterium haemolyticum]
MDGTALYNLAVEAALELPGSEVYSFTEEWEAARVRGKWFMLATHLDDDIIVVKADPEDAASLVEEYDFISPGYHMNKKHWITIRPNGDVDEDLARDLITESYLIVVAKLPRRERPVDPKLYAQAYRERLGKA